MGRREELERILSTDPTDAFALYALGQELTKEGRLVEAISAYDRCFAADPTSCYALYHKARVLEKMGRLDEARASTRQGMAAARACGDSHALGELSSLLDELE